MSMTDLITRINRIFEGLVGCRLEFQAAHALTEAEWESRDLEIFRDGQRETLPPRFVRSHDRSAIGFPVNLHGAFAGLAVISGIQLTHPRKILLLAELLTLMLEAGLQQEERRERLRLIEERLHQLDENSNVIPLRPARLGRVLQLIDTSRPKHTTPSPLASLPLLIETRPGFPLNRLAIEIHNLSGRWAFVDADDLPADIFASRESLEQLGSMTIFIKELGHLSPEAQASLRDYLALRPNGDHPHIIAGTIETRASLESSGKVLPSLLALLNVSRVEFADKTPDQVTADLINASLRHLAEQARESQSHKLGNHYIPFHIQYLDPDQPTVH